MTDHQLVAGFQIREVDGGHAFEHGREVHAAAATAAGSTGSAAAGASLESATARRTFAAGRCCSSRTAGSTGASSHSAATASEEAGQLFHLRIGGRVNGERLACFPILRLDRTGGRIDCNDRSRRVAERSVHQFFRGHFGSLGILLADDADLIVFRHIRERCDLRISEADRIRGVTANDGFLGDLDCHFLRRRAGRSRTRGARQDQLHRIRLDRRHAAGPAAASPFLLVAFLLLDDLGFGHHDQPLGFDGLHGRVDQAGGNHTVASCNVGERRRFRILQIFRAGRGLHDASRIGNPDGVHVTLIGLDGNLFCGGIHRGDDSHHALGGLLLGKSTETKRRGGQAGGRNEAFGNEDLHSAHQYKTKGYGPMAHFLC